MKKFSPKEVFQAVDGTWFFRIRAKNGNILASGAGYNDRRGAERGYRAVVRVILQTESKNG